MKSSLIKLHLAVFLWGFTGVLGRLIQLNEGLLVWYRLIITIVTLLFIFNIKKSFKKIALKTKLNLMSIGILVAVHWVFFYGSIKYANVSISLICLSCIAFFTSLLVRCISNPHGHNPQCEAFRNNAAGLRRQARAAGYALGERAVRSGISATLRLSVLPRACRAVARA